MTLRQRGWIAELSGSGLLTDPESHGCIAKIASQTQELFLVGDLQWPSPTNLDTSATFFFVGLYHGSETYDSFNVYLWLWDEYLIVVCFGLHSIHINFQIFQVNT